MRRSAMRHGATSLPAEVVDGPIMPPVPSAHAPSHEITRAVLDEAFPGDVVGVVNAADLRLGDTSTSATRAYPPIPTLAPEHCVTVRNGDAARHKQFHRGLVQLAEEGVVHLLRRDPTADPTPGCERRTGARITRDRQATKQRDRHQPPSSVENLLLKDTCIGQVTLVP
jgi:hypothetical protein